MSFGWNDYWKPTPVNVRKGADAIVSACVFAGSAISLNGAAEVGTGVFITGFLAKAVSNFFSQKPELKPIIKKKTKKVV